MNIVFWMLAIIVLSAIWLALRFSFWDIGDFFSSLWDEAKDAMNEMEEEDNENE